MIAAIGKVTPEIIGLTRMPVEDKRKRRYRREGSEAVDPATWSAMCRDADAYRVPHPVRGGAVAEYTLRKDAIIGYVVKFKVYGNLYSCRGWSDDKRRMFLKELFGSLKIVAGSIPRDRDMPIFSDQNVRKWVYPSPDMVEDRDFYKWEYVVVGDARDGEGRYCGGQVIDHRLRSAIADKYEDTLRYQLDLARKYGGLWKGV